MSYDYRNLPIEFDQNGEAYVDDLDGFEVPGYLQNDLEDVIPDGAGQVVEEPPEETGGVEEEDIYDVNIDPVTRVAGALAFHAKANLAERTVEEAHSQGVLFRGYEIVLEGRDPRDAIDLSSRTCGVCGAVHSITSSLSLEMAFPVQPPKLGVLARNMGQASAFLYDNPLHLFLLAGPDYSESMLKETNPDLYDEATNTPAPHYDIHGLETIGDIMTELNPMEGDLYLEALEKTRDARQMASLMLGKYPHPSTIAPGGLTTTITRTTFQQFYSRLDDFFDYAKKVAAVWDDLLDFLLEHWDGYEQVGERPKNMINTGVWDDPEVYNARYEDATEWGRARQATPGVIKEGELVTTDLHEVDMGVEEFVDHSFYEDWTGDGRRFETSPDGHPISPYHPWNKDTRPEPEGKSWRDKYSWATAPRWDRTAMETGPHSRQWITAKADEIDSKFVEPTGDGLEIKIPEAEMPEMTVRWDIPDRLNAAERLRAKAHHIGYLAGVCYTNFMEALEAMKEGDNSVHNSFEVPKRGTHRGVGIWEAGRGYLTHHVTIEDGSIDNYQILTPSTWMASPTDSFDQPGPYEEAATNTPFLEQYSGREDFKGADILRAVRSFDPCMPCTVHMHSDRQTDIISKDVSSCGCSFTEGDQAADETIRDIVAGD